MCDVADKPLAPQKLVVTDVSERSVSLKWAEPQYDGGSEITQYIIEEREASRRAWNRAGSIDAADKKVTASWLYTGIALQMVQSRAGPRGNYRALKNDRKMQ